MAIPDPYQRNFDTLLRAARQGDLALMECTDAATGEPRYVICAVGRDAEDFVFTPLLPSPRWQPLRRLSAACLIDRHSRDLSALLLSGFHAHCWERGTLCRANSPEGEQVAFEHTLRDSGALSPRVSSLLSSLKSSKYGAGPQRPQGRRGPTIFPDGSDLGLHREHLAPPEKIVTPTAADAVAFSDP